MRGKVHEVVELIAFLELGIEVNDILSRSRKQDVIEKKEMFFYLLYDNLPGYSKGGMYRYGYHHSTIFHHHENVKYSLLGHGRIKFKQRVNNANQSIKRLLK